MPFNRKEWEKANTELISVRLQKSTDADILDYLRGKSKQGEIKSALREKIQRERKEMKKLKMKEYFTREGYKALTAEERRLQLKIAQASEYSGWRKYPTTCEKLLERIPNEWWGKYSAAHIGEVMAMLHAAYSDGKNDRSAE